MSLSNNIFSIINRHARAGYFVILCFTSAEFTAQLERTTDFIKKCEYRVLGSCEYVNYLICTLYHDKTMYSYLLMKIVKKII